MTKRKPLPPGNYPAVFTSVDLLPDGGAMLHMLLPTHNKFLSFRLVPLNWRPEEPAPDRNDLQRLLTTPLPELES